MKKRSTELVVGAILFGWCAVAASAAGPYAFVTGRRDPAIEIIDLSKVAANNGTSKAIVGRARISPDIPAIDPATSTAKFIGVTMIPAQALPNNVIIRRGIAFVVDHAGISRPLEVESGMPHGYPGALTLLNVRKALDPANNNTTNAIDAIYRTGGWGPAGVVVTPDDKYAIVANSEGPNSEDGAREIGIIDLQQHALVRVLLQALGTGGQVPNTPGHSCAEIARNPAFVPHSSPDVNWGCFPDANGLAFTPLHGGYLFSANEGTNDVSVIDLKKALDGAPGWETFRIPVDRGPWAIAASPDGKLMAVTDRDSDETDEPGQYVSIISVDKAIAKKSGAEIRRVLVGTDTPGGGSHPFSLAWTPDGTRIVVTDDLAGCVSVIDVAKAVNGDPKPEIARIPVGAQPDYPRDRSRPRAVQVTPDSHFAVIAGGPPNTKSGGSLWLIDLRTFKVMGTVTGVGNEPYMLDITDGS